MKMSEHVDNGAGTLNISMETALSAAQLKAVATPPAKPLELFITAM
jgi:hypothetical protein